eukprot:4904090-Amphidinium_carterae.1
MECRFFSDLPVADPALPALQESWIEKQYDEAVRSMMAIEIQKKFTKLGHSYSSALSMHEFLLGDSVR